MSHLPHAEVWDILWLFKQHSTSIDMATIFSLVESNYTFSSDSIMLVVLTAQLEGRKQVMLCILKLERKTNTGEYSIYLHVIKIFFFFFFLKYPYYILCWTHIKFSVCISCVQLASCSGISRDIECELVREWD